MKLVIEDEDVDAVKAVANDCLGLKLSTEQVVEVFADDEAYALDVYQFGAFETEARSTLSNIFSEKLLGREWPTYGEDKAAREQFFKDFEEAAKKAGYEVV